MDITRHVAVDHHSFIDDNYNSVVSVRWTSDGRLAWSRLLEQFFLRVTRGLARLTLPFERGGKLAPPAGEIPKAIDFEPKRQTAFRETVR